MKKIIASLVIVLFYCCSSDSVIDSQNQDNSFVVYPNSGNVLNWVDLNTYHVVREITIDNPDSLQIHRMCLSTNHDFFVFSASATKPPFNQYIISYSIVQDEIHNIFATGLDSIGAPRLSAAQIPEESGLIYFYSHSVGLYSIDFLEQRMNMISAEHAQILGKKFTFSPDKAWCVILKTFGDDRAFSEVEFYPTNSGLLNPEFVLNTNDRDSISIDDLSFSDDNSTLFVSIRLSKKRGRKIANYFGSYDLETKKLYKSSITLPWSLNPYYMAYSSRRQEAYLVGAHDTFYIIDTSQKDYSIKSTVVLSGKVEGPSRILLDPENDVAFVSCSRSNFVLVIDLAQQKVIKRIDLIRPYKMFMI